MKNRKEVILDLKEVYFTDLDGNKIPINIDQKEFGNALFRNATSLEIDEFSRAIHAEGSAPVSCDLIPQIIDLVAKIYGFRASQAIRETIENL